MILFPSEDFYECGSHDVQWYLGIRPLWNKSNLVYVLFGR
jgi:hypothetical protein